MYLLYLLFAVFIMNLLLLNKKLSTKMYILHLCEFKNKSMIYIINKLYIYIHTTVLSGPRI